MLQHGFHQGVVWDIREIPPSISKSLDEKISVTKLGPIESSEKQVRYFKPVEDYQHTKKIVIHTGVFLENRRTYRNLYAPAAAISLSAAVCL
jgi:hypothetical protein